MRVSRHRGLASALWVLLCALGCYAEPPPPMHPGELGACNEGSYGPLSAVVCEHDADCAVCLDGSRCGRAVSSSALEEASTECAVAPASEDCETPYAACCRHRCVLVLEPPQL